MYLPPPKFIIRLLERNYETGSRRKYILVTDAAGGFTVDIDKKLQLQIQKVGYSCSFLRTYYSKNCCRYPMVSTKNIRSSINWSVGPN